MEDKDATGGPLFPPTHTELAREFRAHLASQGLLCQRLEAVADSLPADIQVQECLYVAQSLMPTVMRAHRFEESQVFPLLLRHPPSSELTTTLERLKFEHMGDEDFAGQIELALRDFIKDRKSLHPEVLAWMLRGFFEALRRHIAFEQEHVLPLLEAGQRA